MAAGTKTRAKAEPEMIELVSRSANLWISLETNVDDYNANGGMRTVQRGTRIRFERGRAQVPADWREDIETTRGFGRDFWYAEDPKAVLSFGERQVVSGMMQSALPNYDTEPLDGWDAMGAREIRAALDEGKVEDPRAALAYETRASGGKARVQVIEALGKAIRAGLGDDDDPPADPPADPADPDDDGGL